MKKNSIAILLLLVCATIGRGQTWVPVTGLNGQVNTYVEYRSNLYAGGSFTSNGVSSVKHVGVFNGRAWSAAGAGFDGDVNALIAFDDTLVAAGSFSHSGVTATGSVSMWNGTGWIPMSLGLTGSVYCLARYRSQLYAGGNFTVGGSTYGLAKWNGDRWVSVGASLDNVVNTMCPFGSKLFVGGDFTLIGGNYFNHLAQWDGTSWSAVGKGDSTGANGSVLTMAIYKNRLIVGGALDAVGNAPVSNIGSWDGNSWKSLGSGVNGVVRSLIGTNVLTVGGIFQFAGNLPVQNIAQWTDSSWTPMSLGVDGLVATLVSWSGDIYAGGAFSTTGGLDATNVGQWSSIANKSTIVAMTFVDGDGSLATTSDRLPKTWGMKLYKDSISSGTLLKSVQGNQISISVGQSGNYFVVEADSGSKWSRIGIRPYRIDTIALSLNTTVLDTFVNFNASEGISMSLAEGWNLVSNPLQEADRSTAALFPGASSTLFHFGAVEGYRLSNTAEPGTGYWIKYDVPLAETLRGGNISSLDVAVKSGWNIVGTISTPVSVDSITQQPPGIVRSIYYEYSNGYHQANHLVPGKGYWVKISADGILGLHAQPGVAPLAFVAGTGSNSFDEITVIGPGGKKITAQLNSSDGLGSGPRANPMATRPQVDAAGSIEFPPSAPQSAFGVNTALLPQGGMVFSVAGTTAPVTLRWIIRSGGTYNATNQAGIAFSMVGSGSRVLEPGGSLYTIRMTQEGFAAPVPEKFAMLGNYPNPFNPSTTISLELPSASLVSLTIYDQLGRIVTRLLANELVHAGTNRVVWNGDGAASGIYHAVVSALDPSTGNLLFRGSQKMILLK